MIFFSCGMGVQSAAIVALICNRRLPRPDGIFFCDCHGDGDETDAYAQYLTRYAARRGVKITTLKTGNIWTDGTNPGDNFLFLPAHRLKNGVKQMLRRSCTSHYKVEPILQEIRRRLGVAKGKWCRRRVTQWMGISWDEKHRRSQPKTKWIRNEYPLVKMRWSREDCISYLRKKLIRVPPRSSCVMCPYHTNITWKAIRDTKPKLWEKLCDFDEKIRHLGPGRTYPIFLHRSCVPLRQANIERGWTKKVNRGNR